MKTIVNLAAGLLFLAATHTLFAGFGANGERLPRPERPNPTAGIPPARFPADPIPNGTRDKVKEFIRETLRQQAKKEAGKTAWDLLPAMGAGSQEELFEQKVRQKYDEANPPAGTWDALPEPQRMQKLNQFKNNNGTSTWLECLIFVDLGCVTFDALTEQEKEALIRETQVINIIGLEAWNILDETEQAAMRATVDFDALATSKIDAFRCNVEKAIEFIACIPANSVPIANSADTLEVKGSDIADCLRRTWNARKLCIDFRSNRAFGSILPNCAGKAAGCDPNNNPINIAITTFPCEKKDKIYDPELLSLILTLYHEGVHALQAYNAKPPWPGGGATPEQKAAYDAAMFPNLFVSATNECGAHGSELILLNALCPEVNKLIAGNDDQVVDGGNDYLKKVLACFATIVDDAERADAAKAFKEKLNENVRINKNNLVCYNDYKTIYKDGAKTDRQKMAAVKMLPWTKRRFFGRLVFSGGGQNLIEQVDYDPVTLDPIPLNIDVPVDAVFDIELALDGNFLLALGSEEDSGDGVLFAYTDLDGDGFLDQESEVELLRDFQLFGPMDLVPDPTTGQFLVVNLLSGEIFALGEAPGLANFDFLPDFAFPVGQMELLAGEDFVQRVFLSEDGNTLTGFFGLDAGRAPLMLPEVPITSAFFNPNSGEFEPQPVVLTFDEMLFPPEIVQAGNLPVLTLTSTINQFTNSLTVQGPPNSEAQLFLPQQDLVVGPILLPANGRGVMPLSVQLVPGQELVLQVPHPEDPFESRIFELVYLVRDAAPELVLTDFTAPNLFDFTLHGIPGMPYDLLFSEDLEQPFQPLPMSPILGTELPLPIQDFPLEPLSAQGFFQAQPSPIGGIE